MIKAVLLNREVITKIDEASGKKPFAVDLNEWNILWNILMLEPTYQDLVFVVPNQLKTHWSLDFAFDPVHSVSTRSRCS